MPDVSSSSFIPKRTEGTKIRQKRTRNFFLLSIISYACLIAAPTASAAVYVYQLYTERQFEQIVTTLEAAMGSFSEAEMARVIEFDQRLKMANSLVDNHVSVVKALEALERTTAVESGFTALSMERNPDGSIKTSANILAKNFDIALFQRSSYKDENTNITNASLFDIGFVPPSEQGEGERITMVGEFDFSVSDIRFSIEDGDAISDSTATSDTSTGEVEGAQDEDSTETSSDSAISDEEI